ncbi:MAG: hypothetical protein AB7T59_07500 [Hyphomonadaceae bacterium]
MNPEPLPPETKAARNERRKALAATLNALSVAAIVAALFQPFAAGGNPSLELTLTAMAFFVVFQNLLHYVLRRIED